MPKPPKLTPAQHVFLTVFEEMAGPSGILDMGCANSEARKAVVRRFGMSKSYLSSLLTAVAKTGALEHVHHGGLWRLKVPPSKCVVSKGRVGRPFTRFIPSENPDDCIKEKRELTRTQPIPQPPADTRDLTGRLMGDPLPERSALYKIRSQQSA